jgi:NAD(P)-dependent dehydrogenase (short-subunit alcohol dehydrogenase family)
MTAIAAALEGSTVLVTGGTRGLGKAIGMEFTRAGATVFLTHRWGSVGEAELRAEFAAAGLAHPQVVESDVSDRNAVRELMGLIKERSGRLDVFISNVAFAKVVHELSDLRKGALDLSLAYSTWPLVDHVQAAREVMGGFPRYVLAISSDGPDVCHRGYDLAGASKSALETLCRYLAVRLRAEGVRVNAVRPGLLDTASARATAGAAFIDTVKERAPGAVQDPRGVARACLALCSGLMDSVTGQVLVVDEGWSLLDPLSFLAGAPVPGPFPDAQGGER